MSVSFKEGDLIYTVECAFVGVAVNLKKTLVGNDLTFIDPACNEKTDLPFQDVNGCLMQSNHGDLINQVQNYANVAKLLKPAEDTKDFIDYLIRLNECRKEFDPEKKMRERGEAVLNIKCSFCEKPVPFNVACETEKSANIPAGWVKHREGSLTSSLTKEDLTQRFQVSDTDAPDILEKLISAEEFLKVLETKPLTFRGYEKVAYLINWARKNESDNVLDCANEFAVRIKSLQSDIKKASTVAKEFDEGASKFTQFETDDMQFTFNNILHFGGANREELKRSIEKKARRMLADAILWLNGEIERLVNADKIGTKEEHRLSLKNPFHRNKGIVIFPEEETKVKEE